MLPLHVTVRTVTRKDLSQAEGVLARRPTASERELPLPLARAAGERGGGQAAEQQGTAGSSLQCPGL